MTLEVVNTEGAQKVGKSSTEFHLPHTGRRDSPFLLFPEPLQRWKNYLIILCLSLGKGKASPYLSCHLDSILER